VVAMNELAAQMAPGEATLGAERTEGGVAGMFATTPARLTRIDLTRGEAGRT